MSGNESDRGKIHFQADKSVWDKIDIKNQNNANK